MTEKLAKSGRGGPRPGSGRKPGVRNLVTREFADWARDAEFDVEALGVLYELMWSAENEAVRKSAADSILDRLRGRPVQAVAHTFPKPLHEMSPEEFQRVLTDYMGGKT